MVNFRNKEIKNKKGNTVFFIKVICKDCGAENIIFTQATTRVHCPECNQMQNIPKGGKCELINCRPIQELR